MALRVLGSNHRLAPPSRLQATIARREEILGRLLALQSAGQIRGGVLLCTCNRLEIVLDEDADTTEVRALLSDVPIHEVSGEDATVYLLRVATGLESMVRGEDQILGQLREAFKLAESHCLLSPSLRILRTRLIEAARDIRQRTGLSQARVSVAALAARHLAKVEGHLAVIGTGATGRLAVETLIRMGRRDLLIVNRTYDRARALARHFKGEAMALRDFLAARQRSNAPELGGILVAVRTPQPLLGPEHVRGVELVMDISLPSALDPALREAGPTVLDLDDIAGLVETEDQRRASKLSVAEELVSARAKRIHQSLNGDGRGFAMVIDQHLDSALQEWEACKSKLDHLSDKDKEQIRQLLMRAVRRNAHLHLADLKQLVRS